MGPYLSHLCRERAFEESLVRDELERMSSLNGEKFLSFKTRLEDTEKNLSQSDVFDLKTEEAIYYCKIGDKVAYKGSTPSSNAIYPYICGMRCIFNTLLEQWAIFLEGAS